MHNVFSRVSNVFSFFTTVVTVIATVIAILGLVTTPAPPVKENALRLNNVQVVKGRPHYYSNKKEEFAHIKFDLDIDLSSLFTWNTKQIFLYITATYPSGTSPTSPPSTAIIWDAILPHPLAPTHRNTYAYPTDKSSKSKPKRRDSSPKTGKPDAIVPGLLRLPAQRPKYQITDPSGRLAERSNATLELNWNVQPWVGALQWSSGGRGSSMGLFGLEKFVGTWRGIEAEGARTEAFDLPMTKERAEAVKEAGKEGLGTEKGGERNRGSPS